MTYVKVQLSTVEPRMYCQAFRLATQMPYGYLIVDLDSKSDKRFRLRTNIFPGEATIIYDIDSA